MATADETKNAIALIERFPADEVSSAITESLVLHIPKPMIGYVQAAFIKLLGARCPTICDTSEAVIVAVPKNDVEKLASKGSLMAANAVTSWTGKLAIQHEPKMSTTRDEKYAFSRLSGYTWANTQSGGLCSVPNNVFTSTTPDMWMKNLEPLMQQLGMTDAIDTQFVWTPATKELLIRPTLLSYLKAAGFEPKMFVTPAASPTTTIAKPAIHITRATDRLHRWEWKRSYDAGYAYEIKYPPSDEGVAKEILEDLKTAGANIVADPKLWKTSRGYVIKILKDHVAALEANGFKYDTASLTP